MVTGIALLIFAGAMGKSAQFPLHVWLPDAMEGPTPVSALIHAATMVNAGVYLVARVNPLFGHAQEAMVVVAAIGIFTAILAASIALTQTDIKRVLAYSTLSQLGYMFAALGVGAWGAAIFHLLAQGFTKGLLFLASGSVIHAVGDEQDMRRMGGLRRKIPITYATMVLGAVAMAGIPPLVPFFSKDEILGSAFKNGFLWVWAVGFVVAGMTAFYMFRLIGLTFWGESRVDPKVEPHIHESPRSMTVPLILLALGVVVIGLVVGVPPETGLIAQWLDPIFAGAFAVGGREPDPYRLFGIDGGLALASVTVASIGIVVAWRRSESSCPACGACRVRSPFASSAPAFRSSTGRRSTNGGSMTSTTCSSSGSAGGSRRSPGGSTGRSSTAPSTGSAPSRSTPGAACDGFRRDASRTTDLGSRSDRSRWPRPTCSSQHDETALQNQQAIGVPGPGLAACGVRPFVTRRLENVSAIVDREAPR
jgi:NADH:ubiquinone oxidoreductase subunit 5 (subunit L)/multisubunit Na+/H+ antiporter MnhA subunit